MERCSVVGNGGAEVVAVYASQTLISAVVAGEAVNETGTCLSNASLILIGRSAQSKRYFRRGTITKSKNLMPDVLGKTIFFLNLASFVYCILVAQVHWGLIPFYKERGRIPRKSGRSLNKDVERQILFHIGPAAFVFFCLFVISNIPGFDLLFLGCMLPFAWAGFKMRSDFAKDTYGPVWWRYNYWLIRWPMLLYDLWSIGGSAVFFLILLGGISPNQ